MARPSLYSLELGIEICQKLMEGMSLRSICREEGMPSISSVMLWLSVHPEFSAHYTRAREIQADTMADELLEICDDSTNDWMEKQNKDGSTYLAIDQEHINRSRLRVDTRKWIASKLKPKKYGDRLTVESTVKHTADAYTDDELAAIASAGRPGIAEQTPSKDEPGSVH